MNDLVKKLNELDSLRDEVDQEVCEIAEKYLKEFGPWNGGIYDWETTIGCVRVKWYPSGCGEEEEYIPIEFFEDYEEAAQKKRDFIIFQKRIKEIAEFSKKVEEERAEYERLKEKFDNE